MKPSRALALVVLMAIFNANASLVNLAFKFDTVTHSVSRYDKASHTEYIETKSKNKKSDGILHFSFNTVSQSINRDESTYLDDDYSQKSYSTYFFNDQNFISIDSEWSAYFDSFALSSPNFHNKDTTIQSTQGSFVYNDFNLKYLDKLNFFTTLTHMNSGYTHFGDRASGNYTETLTQYIYYNALRTSEFLKNSEEDPRFTTENELLNDLLTKDIYFSSYFSHKKIITTYENHLFAGQILEDFASEQYMGRANLVSEVTTPSTITILFISFCGLLTCQFRKKIGFDFSAKAGF